MRFRLRTLLIVLAVGPPIGAWGVGEIAAYLQRLREKQVSDINEPRLLVRPIPPMLPPYPEFTDDPLFPEPTEPTY